MKFLLLMILMITFITVNTIESPKNATLSCMLYDTCEEALESPSSDLNEDQKYISITFEHSNLLQSNLFKQNYTLLSYHFCEHNKPPI